MKGDTIFLLQISDERPSGKKMENSILNQRIIFLNFTSY